MKCLYYLAPTLDSTHGISDDLHAVGVRDFFVHVISRDEAGLKKQHIHSSNYLETLDVVRDGVIGGVVGFIVGLVGVASARVLRPVRHRGPELRLLRARRRRDAVRHLGRRADRHRHREQQAREVPRRHRGRQVPGPDLCTEGAGSSGAADDARAPSRGRARRRRPAFRQSVQFTRARRATPGRRRPAPAEGVSAMAIAIALVLLVHRHGRVPFPESLVVHADRVELGTDGRHRQPHLLGHRRRVRRREPVHGLRDRPLPPPQGRSSGAPSTSRRTRNSSGG